MTETAMMGAAEVGKTGVSVETSAAGVFFFIGCGSGLDDINGRSLGRRAAWTDVRTDPGFRDRLSKRGDPSGIHRNLLILFSFRISTETVAAEERPVLFLVAASKDNNTNSQFNLDRSGDLEDTKHERRLFALHHRRSQIADFSLTIE